VDVKRYEIDMGKLRRDVVTEGSLRRLSRPAEHIDELHSVYSQYARQYNGMLDRDSDWWKDKVLGSGQVYVYEDS
jgi:predicted acetyltransferase